LPEQSVQTCVTSPPYFGLRDYGMADQIGLEQTPDAFVAELVSVFREVKRVLRDDGTLWLNLGDSYAGSGKGRNGDGSPSVDPASKQATSVGTIEGTLIKSSTPDCKPKDLIGIPWRVAFALQADGWYLRQDIIWHKPNPMPESVKDRCTKAHEYIFLLTKSDRYFYDAEAVAEDSTGGTKGAAASFKREDSKRGAVGIAPNSPMPTHRPDRDDTQYDGPTRNRRSVWTVATKPYSGAHFATFPTDLIDPCVKAGTSQHGACSSCGAPWERETERERSYDHTTTAEGKSKVGPYAKQTGDGEGTHDIRHGVYSRVTTTGWKASCGCNAEVVPCVVLDPFGGAGTTGLVADRLGRDAILCELNPEYAKMAGERIAGENPMFTQVSVE
jgi:DNA modification methylase